MSGPHIRGEYPTDWDLIARRVKDRAAWRCVRCFHKHEIPTGHVLTVHHFDGDKSNVRRWNLMPLCQRCHLSIQSRVDPRQPIMFDPSAWALPYIAGFLMANDLADLNPCFDLATWREDYQRDVGGWPGWAPRSDDDPRFAEGGDER